MLAPTQAHQAHDTKRGRRCFAGARSKLCRFLEPASIRAQGTKDEVVDISAGRALHAAAQHPAEPLWIEGCDHQSVELSVTYLPRMRRFIESCMQR